jgi:3-oxoacyl-[acyl-carrier protein] reductase
MLLRDKTAVIYGAGGAVGRAVAQAFGREGAAELGPQGVRVACIRAHRIADSGLVADFPMGEDEFRRFLEGMTLLKRLPMLAEVANTAVFLASDHAAAMTGAVANLTCGMSVD